jgi:hypothetical protein
MAGVLRWCHSGQNFIAFGRNHHRMLILHGRGSGIGKSRPASTFHLPWDPLIQVPQSVRLPANPRSTEHEDFLHAFSTDGAYLRFRQHGIGKQNRSVSQRAGFDGELFRNEKINK